MKCDLVPHSETQHICQICNRTITHGGHPPEKCHRECRGPNAVRRVATFARAATKHIANGMQLVPEAEKARRLSICESNVCGKYKAGRCQRCTCSLQIKAGWALEQCPDTPSQWGPWRAERKPGPLRVAFLTPSLGQGGAERWIVDLCRYMPACDIDVRSAWLIDGGQSWQPVVDELVSLGVNVYGGPNLMPGRPNAVSGITRIGPHLASLTAALQDVDIAITWGLPNLTDLLRGSQFAGRVIVVSHGEADATKELLAASIAGATDFAAVSEQARLAFPTQTQPRCGVLWNGCNTDRLQIIQGRAVQRSLWGLADDEIAIGYLGRLHHQKRPLTAVHAAAACGDKFRPVLIGEGLHQTEIIREARRLAGDRLIAPGAISPIGDALAALDVWVLGSPAEGFSIALLEAWAAGVPVVSTRVGCLNEIEQQFGAMVTEISVDASEVELRSAIHHALSPSGRSIANRARQVALEHLTAELSAQRWAEWLREICPVAV